MRLVTYGLRNTDGSGEGCISSALSCTSTVTIIVAAYTHLFEFCDSLQKTIRFGSKEANDHSFSYKVDSLHCPLRFMSTLILSRQ